MKKVIPLILLFFISISISIAQTAKEKNNPVGQWKFEAPYAPEGYTSGVINVGYAERKYSATMEFAGIDYKFVGANVKFTNDSLFFAINVEDEYVSVSLKMESASKMSGKGVYSEGEVLLMLTKSEGETKQ
jgi:hypothetical protein